MSTARFSKYGRKSVRVNNRSPSAMGVDVEWARSAISFGWLASSGSVIMEIIMSDYHHKDSIRGLQTFDEKWLEWFQ
jgi:hypothetical protein